MIPKDKLIYGQFYDGFTWVSGTQRGVATMGWDGEEFQTADGNLTMSYTHNGDGFEPNVVSHPPEGVIK